MSAGTREALESLPLRYCATRDSVLAIGSDRRIPAPSLVVNAGYPLRRALSPLWNRVRLQLLFDVPVLRAALHPLDIRHRGIESHWRHLLAVLADRAVVTEGQLLSTP